MQTLYLKQTMHSEMASKSLLFSIGNSGLWSVSRLMVFPIMYDENSSHTYLSQSQHFFSI